MCAQYICVCRYMGSPEENVACSIPLSALFFYCKASQ